MNTRRNFLTKIVASACIPALALQRASAQAPPAVKLEESDPIATALGYKEDTTKVDAAKYPLHNPSARAASPNGETKSIGSPAMTDGRACGMRKKIGHNFIGCMNLKGEIFYCQHGSLKI